MFGSLAASWDQTTYQALYRDALILILCLCPIVFSVLMLLPAAYGRHKKKQPHWLWGPGVPTRWTWLIMEAPSSIGFAAIFFCGQHAFDVVPLVLLLMWQSHYFQRSFVFPFLMKVRPGDTTPLAIPLMAFCSNIVISFLNAATLSWTGLGRDYGAGWLLDPRFLAGAAVFAAGYHINRKADAMLAALRKPGETGYRIPHGWLYETVTCPNYLGEILIWTGWAIATWSAGGLAFLLWTLANLTPRALTNHRWYHEKFPDYPRQRKVLIPYVL